VGSAAAGCVAAGCVAAAAAVLLCAEREDPADGSPVGIVW
jgi:hypothetical protein